MHSSKMACSERFFHSLPLATRHVASFCLLALVLGTSACGDSPSKSVDAGQNKTPDAGSPDGGLVSGVGLLVEVLGWGGHPVFEGTITIAGQEESIVSGRAVFENLPEGKVLGIVRAPGFVTSNVFGRVVSGESTVAQALLLPVGVSVEFAADQPAAIYHGTIGVHVDANSFVDGQGDLVTGLITAHLTDFDPASDMPASPGPFRGQSSGGGEVELIESFGMANFSFEANGNPVQLAVGKTADIEIGVPPSAGISRLETIPAWSYDLEQGHWVEEGVGTVYGSDEFPVWKATVEHFSYWNADRKVAEKECVIVELPFSGGSNGVPVYSEGIDYTGVDIGATEEGSSCVEYKKGSSATIHAGSGSHGYTFSQTVVGSGEPADCGGGGAGCTTLIIDIPQLSCVKGKVVQAGLETEGALVVLEYGPAIGYGRTDVNGDFCNQVPVNTRVVAEANLLDSSGLLTSGLHSKITFGEASCGVLSECVDLGLFELSTPLQYCLDGQITSDSVFITNESVPLGTPLLAFRANTFTGLNCSTSPESWGVVVAEGTIGADGEYCLTVPLGENNRDLVFVANSCDRDTCITDIPSSICSGTDTFNLATGAETGFVGSYCGSATTCISHDMYIEF